MADLATIGVVTVTYNSGQVIGEFLTCLFQQTYSDFKLYVIDNASSDGTVEYVARYRDQRVVLIPNPTNLGVAEGNNIGIRAALEDGCGLVLLINNDTVFDPDLVRRLRGALEEYQSEMVAPKILYFSDPGIIWYAGGYLSRLRANGRHFGYRGRDNGQFDQPRAVSYSPTCCLLTKREVFDRIGLMDSTYFAYFDDTDFCLRAHRAGIRLFYVPSIVLLHKISALTKKVPTFAAHYMTRNHAYYILKNFPRWQAWLYLAAFQLRLFSKYVLPSVGRGTLAQAEKDFLEGIRLYHSRTKGCKTPSTFGALIRRESSKSGSPVVDSEQSTHG